MANPTNNPVLQLQLALQELKNSDIQRAKAEVQYSKLEVVVREQLRENFTDLSESESKTQVGQNAGNRKSISNMKGNHRGDGGASTLLAKKPSSYAFEKRGGGGECGIPLSKKSSSNSNGITCSTRLTQDQLIRRIRQYHENMDSIAAVDKEPAPEKDSFLKHLQRLNSNTWKTQKSVNPSISKLERHIRSTKNKINVNT